MIRVPCSKTWKESVEKTGEVLEQPLLAVISSTP